MNAVRRGESSFTNIRHFCSNPQTLRSIRFQPVWRKLKCATHKPENTGSLIEIPSIKRAKV